MSIGLRAFVKHGTVWVTLAVAAVTTFAAHAQMGRPNICSNYPAEAVSAGHKGKIDLAFTITTDGTVQDLRILNSSGFPELDQAALKCAQDWHYRPALANGRPAASPWRASVVFGLEALPERPALRQLIRDMRECVERSSVLDRRPKGFFGITDLKLAFTSGRDPNVTILGKSGVDELDAKALECARSSPALADVAREISAPSWVLSFNWRVML